MFKTYSSSNSLVITSRWFATSRLRVPVSVRLVYGSHLKKEPTASPVLTKWWKLELTCYQIWWPNFGYQIWFCTRLLIESKWCIMHICISELTIIVSDNGLFPGWRQAIIWTNAGILLFGPLETNFCEIWIKIQTFSLKKMHLKMSSAKWRSFCPD